MIAPQLKAVVLDNGVDPANLGKGDWIYILSTAISQHGGSVASLMAYEKSQGMDYVIIKTADGASNFPTGSPQFTSNVVDSAHAAGLKVFGYIRSWGTNIPGEISVITNAMNLGVDGYVIDAEIEWESQNLANNKVAATNLCQGIRAAFPKRFLAHSPFPIISVHSSFPYREFGLYCDAVMPQAYAGLLGYTPSGMVTKLDQEWKNWQNALPAAYQGAKKPIAPAAQAWDSSGSGDAPTTGVEVDAFIDALKADPSPATPGGYKGINFWRAELHTSGMWDAMRTNTFGDPQPIAPFVYRVTATNISDTSATITWITSTNADSVLDFGGLATGYTNSITNATLLTSHSMTITGLTQTTSYRFRVRSKVGGSTNVTYSGNFTFTTKVAGFVPDIILDNTNATVVGTWSTSSSSTDRYGADYRFRGVGTGANYLTYTPAIPQSGLYQIYESHPQGSNRATNAPHIITYYGGVQTNFVNQSVGGGVAGGTFNLLTTVYFQAGNSGSVKITDTFTTTTGQQVMADAIKFVYVGQPSPPNITTQPQGRTVNIGSNVTFTVAASGIAPLTYQWQFQGNDIPGATTNTYVRMNAQPENAGVYSVVVSNPGGETESVGAVLSVNTPPSITGEPGSQTVNQGEPATFYASATGFPDPAYQWWFANAPIPGATQSSFTRPAAQPNQAGNYWVVASNAFGAVTSSVVTLTVNVPPGITTHPLSQSVPAGSNVVFSVIATGTAPLFYQWNFNGSPIAAATDSSYSISDVQSNHVGGYSVVITNMAGSITSSNATLSLAAQQPAEFQLVERMTDGQVHLIISGAQGATYSIDGSSNLVDWSELMTEVNANGTLDLIDHSASNSAIRFYRTRQ